MSVEFPRMATISQAPVSYTHLKIIQQVHLVDDRDRRTCFAQCFHHAKLGFGKFPGRLKQQQGHIHSLQAGGGGLGHAGIQPVARLMDARGIQQHILYRSLGDNAGNTVAGRLCLLGDVYKRQAQRYPAVLPAGQPAAPPPERCQPPAGPPHGADIVSHWLAWFHPLPYTVCAKKRAAAQPKAGKYRCICALLGLDGRFFFACVL